MVFGLNSAPAVGAKGTIINMIINNWLNFPFVYMTDGKYHIKLSVHLRDNHNIYIETIIFKNIIFIISYDKYLLLIL